MTMPTRDHIALDPVAAVMDATGTKHPQRVYDYVRDGTMTRPIHVGRSARWPRHEVRAIVLARIGGATDDGIRALVVQLHAQRAVITAAAA